MKAIHSSYLTAEEEELTERLKILRGAKHHSFKLKVYDALADAIKIEAHQIIWKDSKFSSIDIAAIALKFNLSFKVACEFLEKLGILKPGTFDRLDKYKSFTITEVMDAGREKLSKEQMCKR